MRMFGKLIGMGAAALSLTAFASPPAHAKAGSICRILPVLCTRQPPQAAPEIDPNLLRGTLTVLTGGVLILTERRRRRR